MHYEISEQDEWLNDMTVQTGVDDHTIRLRPHAGNGWIPTGCNPAWTTPSTRPSTAPTDPLAGPGRRQHRPVGRAQRHSPPQQEPSQRGSSQHGQIQLGARISSSPPSQMAVIRSCLSSARTAAAAAAATHVFRYLDPHRLAHPPSDARGGCQVPSAGSGRSGWAADRPWPPVPHAVSAASASHGRSRRCDDAAAARPARTGTAQCRGPRVAS